MMAGDAPRPEPGQPAHSRYYLLRRLGRLIRKEVSTILRDRRTIITLVLMPLLLYPLLGIAFQQFSLSSEEKKRVPEYRIGVLRTEVEDGLLIKKAIEDGNDILNSNAKQPGFPLEPPFHEDPPVAPTQYPIVDDFEKALSNGSIDIGVKLRGRRERAWVRGKDTAFYCDVHYIEGSPNGLAAKAWVERRLAAANDQQLISRLGAIPNAPPIQLIATRAAAMKAPTKEQTLPLSSLVPLILILMTSVGAVYPAIDLTAGERERGTLEVLVAAPVPRFGLLFAKYVSVMTVAVLTATVNLVMMIVTALVFRLDQMPELAGLSLSLGLIFAVFALMILFAAFFSAVLLAVTSFARSFKEAQAYLIPLTLVSLFVGLLAILPVVKLGEATAVVPLLNIVLLTRDLLEGNASLWAALVVIITTLIYALVAINLAARIFGAEAVLYNEQSGWGDLFRRPLRSQPAATVSGALLCLALLFPLAFVLNGSLGRLDVSILTKILLQTAATILLFGLIPLYAAWMGRVRFREGFRTARSGMIAWLPALLLGLSIWPLASTIELATRGLYAPEFRDRLIKLAGEFVEKLRELSPIVLVIAMGIITPVLEELFFRGYLLSALLRKSRPGVAIVTSGVFFGLFHVAGAKLILVEQAIITTTLGILLGWICWRSGSVYPGMLLHVAHNSILLLLAYYNPQWVGGELPVIWLVGAGLVVALALALLWFVTRSLPTPRAQSDLPGGDEAGIDDFRSPSFPSRPDDESHGNRQGNGPTA